jgi:hypothetical protein
VNQVEYKKNTQDKVKRTLQKMNKCDTLILAAKLISTNTGSNNLCNVHHHTVVQKAMFGFMVSAGIEFGAS